jgi:ankyrin repeat protein
MSSIRADRGYLDPDERILARAAQTRAGYGARPYRSSVNAAEELLRAAEADDLDGVREALRSGAPPDTTAEDYAKTPVLTVAAARGATEVVELLLSAGAAANPESSYEWTPLRAAATYGRARVVELLLAAGVDPNLPSRRGPILMDAVASTRHWPKPDSLEAVRLLLEAGAAVRPGDDPAAVMAIASESPSAVLRLLLELGADPNATRSDGAPAIVIAAMRRNASLVDELLAGGADVEAADSNGRTALMHAVERGSDQIVASLLCAGANKDTKAVDESSAHDLALAWGRQNVRFMMGEKSVGRELLSVPRTVIFQRAGVVQLLADRQELEQLAMAIDHAIDDLGVDEFETLVGASAEAARRVSDRLRHAQEDHPQGSNLKQVEITRDEQQTIRGALLNLAYGPPMEMPPGLTRVQMADMFEDFNEFYR